MKFNFIYAPSYHYSLKFRFTSLPLSLSSLTFLWLIIFCTRYKFLIISCVFFLIYFFLWNHKSLYNLSTHIEKLSASFGNVAMKVITISVNFYFSKYDLKEWTACSLITTIIKSISCKEWAHKRWSEFEYDGIIITFVMSCSVNKFHADLHNKIEKILFSGQHFEGVAYRVKRRADIKLIFIDDKFMNVHKREYKLCSLDLFLLSFAQEIVCH